MGNRVVIPDVLIGNLVFFKRQNHIRPRMLLSGIETFGDDSPIERIVFSTPQIGFFQKPVEKILQSNGEKVKPAAVSLTFFEKKVLRTAKV